tara:strand:+ start:5781 stop:6377 length:597 start_codon:yes stop_codon:yes gene_type:complete
MKITTQQIRQLIKEELQNVINEKEQLDEGIGAMLAFATVLFGGQVQETPDGTYTQTGEPTHQVVSVDGAEFSSPEQLAKALDKSGLVKDADADRGISNVQDSKMVDADAEYTGFDIDPIDGQGVSSYMGSFADAQGDTPSDLMNQLSGEANPRVVKDMLGQMDMNQAKELVPMDGFLDLDPVIQKAIKAKAGLMNPVR